MLLGWDSENWQIHFTAGKRAGWHRLGAQKRKAVDQPVPHPPRHLYLRGFSILEVSSQLLPGHPPLPGQKEWPWA